MSSKRGPYKSGLETKTVLVLSAERLFAERGIAAVTMADIRRDAGQSNTATVRYHFGSKEALLRAVFEYRLPSINVSRRLLLSELPERPSCRELINALVTPMVQTLTADNYYLAFLNRLREEGLAEAMFGAISLETSETGRIIDELLDELLQQLPDWAARQRKALLYSSVLNSMRASGAGPRRPTSAELVGLFDAWEGMLTAPSTLGTADDDSSDLSSGLP